VAATSSFDSIVAVVALVATVFGIYELSSICTTAVVTASNSHVSSYPMQLDIPVYLLLTTIVGAITLTIAILFLQRPTDYSRVDLPTTRAASTFGAGLKLRQRALDTPVGGGNEPYGTSRDQICKPAGESEHYYSSDPSGRSGRPAVLRHLRPAASRTTPTLRAFVDQYRRTVTQLDAMNAPIPSVLTHSRMTELAEINDDYMSPISQDDDDRIYSPVDGNESYRDMYIRQHDYSPASDEQSPRVQSYLTTKMNQGPFQDTKDLLSTRPSRTQTGENIHGCTTPIFKGRRTLPDRLLYMLQNPARRPSL
jgi:hypothetical protein